MFPPGRGNDNLDAGDIYLISVFGTNEVLAAAGGELCLREYQEGHHDQMWICETNSDYRIGMRNKHTGFFLGRGEKNILRCIVPQLLPWERLTFTRLSLGGYSLRVSPDGGEKLSSLRVDSNSPHLKIGGVHTQFGLHKIKNPVFRRFEWVIPDRLARSSAPYYDGEDADESINETSIEFLSNYGIKNIISLNSVELSQRQRDRLRAAKISYSHIKAVECAAVTQEQFDRIWSAYSRAGVTIVYCGYGDGRTGMAISAIQLFQGRALNDNDYRGNGVQCPSQIAALNTLRDRINGDESHRGPIDTLDTQPPSYTTPEKKKDHIEYAAMGFFKGEVPIDDMWQCPGAVEEGRNFAIIILPTLEKRLEE
ncbi:hypothetical protein B9Z19DRAFT_1089422 [Tuber borchii]|uniref:Tyrosine specific protein phosphatases domain-containing protein n=1 Tax=Tuber borchii TaxID=42251 RepID=A0A2T6ZK70_TUBBO|nr:hypothetical protein B9Z19DRAFT_1089422 [Tuber borchii]